MKIYTWKNIIKNKVKFDYKNSTRELRKTWKALSSLTVFQQLKDSRSKMVEDRNSVSYFQGKRVSMRVTQDAKKRSFDCAPHSR